MARKKKWTGVSMCVCVCVTSQQEKEKVYPDVKSYPAAVVCTCKELTLSLTDTHTHTHTRSYLPASSAVLVADGQIRNLVQSLLLIHLLLSPSLTIPLLLPHLLVP